MQLIFPDGTTAEGQIVLFMPYEKPGAEVRCKLELIGLLPRALEIAGVSSFQALALAVHFVEGHLRTFIGGGGRVLLPESQMDLDLAGLFGHAI